MGSLSGLYILKVVDIVMALLSGRVIGEESFFLGEDAFASGPSHKEVLCQYLFCMWVFPKIGVPPNFGNIHPCGCLEGLLQGFGLPLPLPWTHFQAKKEVQGSKFRVMWGKVGPGWVG